ncbi:hypothetical protein CROQUDRAFT_88434 [Cronartium quercuum f. sp. fusiforme G11]|uniref:Uncharacterized protein n=1 Tax=Cronartium quercuum f. sp. fusiforme G11 TaxID=708437 RepID=A0A9P6NTV5_9BASI|nr:hypothetical protein CROQUDRAFT_88434 [Cronartium quercuum f. sp. fusiforme G11]
MKKCSLYPDKRFKISNLPLVNTTYSLQSLPRLLPHPVRIIKTEALQSFFGNQMKRTTLLSTSVGLTNTAGLYADLEVQDTSTPIMDIFSSDQRNLGSRRIAVSSHLVSQKVLKIEPSAHRFGHMPPGMVTRVELVDPIFRAFRSEDLRGDGLGNHRSYTTYGAISVNEFRGLRALKKAVLPPSVAACTPNFAQKLELPSCAHRTSQFAQSVSCTFGQIRNIFSKDTFLAPKFVRII